MWHHVNIQFGEITGYCPVCYKEVHMIYFDNAATTRIDDRVFDAMLPYLKEQYGNPGALYGLGREAKLAVARARD